METVKKKISQGKKYENVLSFIFHCIFHIFICTMLRILADIANYDVADWMVVWMYCGETAELWASIVMPTVFAPLLAAYGCYCHAMHINFSSTSGLECTGSTQFSDASLHLGLSF